MVEVRVTDINLKGSSTMKTWQQVATFVNRNKDNDNQIFIWYHGGYIAPHHRESYAQFKREWKVKTNIPMVREKYGTMYETFEYWVMRDTANGVESID